MGKIFVEGIKLYAYHGCFKEEQLIGTNFNVDVELDTDLEKASVSDNLYDTIDYQRVFQIVKEEMAIPSKLLEHVGKRIMDHLFREFETLEKVKLKISKLNPPLGGQLSNVSIQIEKQRK